MSVHLFNIFKESKDNDQIPGQLTKLAIEALRDGMKSINNKDTRSTPLA